MLLSHGEAGEGLLFGPGMNKSRQKDLTAERMVYLEGLTSSNSGESEAVRSGWKINS
jgi:hypothetical protein